MGSPPLSLTGSCGNRDQGWIVGILAGSDAGMHHPGGAKFVDGRWAEDVRLCRVDKKIRVAVVALFP